MKKVHVIGAYHADMAWKKGAGEMEELWESFILRLIDLLEQYPEFTYVLEQAAHFRQMAADRPDLVERIVKYVRLGRVEVVGGMATTMETNIPCGESFVRNLLLGRGWFRQNMGVESKTGWLIDTFGVNAQVPQLLNQAGIRRLIANRFGNEMKHDLFTAVGIDGSRLAVAGREVFAASAMPEGRVFFEFTQTWKHTDSLFRLAAEAQGDGPFLLMPYVENEYLPSKRIDMDLQYIRSRGDGEYFYSLPSRFFDDVERWQSLPEVFSDLNPEFTGTYSQRMPIRLINRRVEGLLLEAEKWAALLNVREGVKDAADGAWWKMAFNHFHDVFTGSHPTEVFNYVVDNFRYAESAAIGILQKTFGARPTPGAEPGKITVLNGLPRDRREVVSIPLSETAGGGFRVSRGSSALPGEVHGGSLRFIADLKAACAEEFTVERDEGASTAEWEPVERAVIENEFISLEASAENGIESLLYRPTGKVLARHAGAMLVAQLDAGNFQIEQPCGGEMSVLASGAKLFKSESALGRRILLKGTMKKLHWSSKEDIFGWSAEFFLPDGIQRLDATFHVDWRASGVRLRLKLPTEIDSSAGVYEIPFGAVRRKPYMSAESKKGEWPAQRFVAVEDGSFGVALVNTGVPGVEVAGGTIWSTLLRSPTSEYAGMNPDDTSSLHGEHAFPFAIVPYRGYWQDSPVLACAESLNNPALTLAAAGVLPCGKSLMRLEGGTAALSAVKLPEDEAPGEIIVRLYEAGGRECRAELFIEGADAAWQSDIVEARGERIICDGGSMRMDLNPFEIKTLRIKLAGK